MIMTTKLNSDLGKRGIKSNKNLASLARWRGCEKAGNSAPLYNDCFNTGTWNVRGLLEPGKMANVIQEMERMQIDILGLSETHWKEVGEFSTSIPTIDSHYSVIYSGGKQSRQGVAFIMNEKSRKSMLYYHTVNERIILTKLQEKSNEVLIVQIYGFTEDAEREDVEEFYELLESTIKEHKKNNDKVIIMGDFNARVGNKKCSNIVGNYGLGQRTVNGDRLIEFCNKQQMCITNTWFEQKESARYTWTSPDLRTKNQIDYILVNFRYRNSIQNSKSRPGADCGSDHNPVLVKTRTKLKIIKKKNKRSKKWNTQILKNEIVKESFKTKFDNIYEEEKNMEANELWNKIKKCVEVTAEEICGKDKQDKKQKWMTIDILKKMEERRKLKSLVNTECKQKELTKEIQRECRKAKKNYYQQQCEELEELDKIHSPKLYKKIKELTPKSKKIQLGIKDCDGKMLYEEELITKRWEEYIGKDLYNDERKVTPEMNKTYENISKIDEDEIREVIKDLPKEKATGDDNINAELLQNLGEKGIQAMTELINSIYIKGDLPHDFLKSVFVPIPKVNKAMECNEYRTISLISHAAKILLKVIKKRITPSIENRLSENQLGFRKGKGTRDAIFITRVLIERAIEKKKTIYLCFIDYTKAFDRVRHDKLMELMRKTGIPNHEIRLIANLYWRQTATVRTNKGETEEIEIKRGIRQGCILSPVLFNLYSEYLIEEALNNSSGLKINGQNVNNIRFADDTVLIAESIEDLQGMVKALNDECKVFGMSLNAKKTKIMVIDKKEKVRCKIKVDGKELEQVKEYKYLGTWITDDGRCEEEVRRRIGKAKNDFWKFKEILRGNIDLNLKKRLLKTYIFSVVGYASEAWTYSKKIINKLHAFEMWCYRRLLKISWTEKVSNKRLLERIGNKMILVEELFKRKMRFAGHIMRGSSGQLTQLVLEGMIDGQRDRGRQRRTWGEDIKEWSGSKSIEIAKRRSENRRNWRVMVTNLLIEDGT